MDIKMEIYNIHEVEINLHPKHVDEMQHNSRHATYDIMSDWINDALYKILDNSPYDVCMLTSIMMNDGKVGDLVELIMYKGIDPESDFRHTFTVDEIMHDLETLTRFMK
jgi:hypothetical protein